VAAVTGFEVDRLHQELDELTAAPGRGAGSDRPRVRGKTIASWFFLFLSVAYFSLPLIGTLIFSLRAQPMLSAYADMINDPRVWTTLGYSFVIGVITIIVSMTLLVPTAFWVRLRLPRLRPVVEFITLLPFVVPPIILVFGLITRYSQPPLPLTGSNLGSDALLVCAYVVLSFPYMYRAVDTGLRSIDIRSLTEASQSLGAGWATILWRVILPNLRVSILSGAFLTLAIVVGEFTIANFLARPMFATYLQLISGNLAYQPAAVALMSFAITWAAMGVISLLGRGSRTRIEIGGAR
jgi:putative spermidine/putrescine transport system permease protein